MDYQFRYINADLLPQCIGILKDFFGQNYYGAEPRFLAWQYRDSIFKTLLAGKDEYSILAMVENGRVLALDAFMPFKTIVRGRDVLTVWDIEWMNAAQIKGLGRRLVTELRSRCELYCGYGVNSLSGKAYEKLGFAVLPEIERMVAIIDPDRCAALFAGDSAEKAEFIRTHGAGSDRASYVTIREVARISDRYFADQLGRMEGVSYKGPDYLKWRFIDHPFLRYELLSLDEEARAGIAVVRVEKIKNIPYKILRVLDLLPALGREYDLVEAVLRYARDREAILADFFCASSAYAGIICPEPFMPLAVHRRHDIPMLFQPMEVRERKSINMVLDADVALAEIDFHNLYATKADGDQDVYLNEDYETILL